jgi:hypothetical protein
MDIDFNSLQEAVNIIVKYVLKNIIDKKVFHHFLNKICKKNGELLIRCHIIFIHLKLKLIIHLKEIYLLTILIFNYYLLLQKFIYTKILFFIFLKIYQFLDIYNIINKITIKYSSEFFFYIHPDITGFYYPIQFTSIDELKMIKNKLDILSSFL